MVTTLAMEADALRLLQRAALRLGDGLRRLWRRRRAVHRAARGHACEEVAASEGKSERDATDDAPRTCSAIIRFPTTTAWWLLLRIPRNSYWQR